MHDAVRALSAWSWPSSPSLEVNRDGLINRTFVVSVNDQPASVLQQLNTRIFVPEVHEDIEAVTRRLAFRGMATPHLLRTIRGDLWHVDDASRVWRCMTYEGNRTIHKVSNLRDAREAGALAARFHAAVRELEWSFRSVRAGAHDTPRHMELLEEAVRNRRGHRLHDHVERLADEIHERWSSWGAMPSIPVRVVHGDMKISNVRFLDERAHCLIDLDTMAMETLAVELGDAMRSWCNPASEDSEETVFDLAIFGAAMEGYAAGSGSEGPSESEWAAIVPGVERIALELAARFARDALEETYFGWDDRFGSRGDHNLLRARGQLALARSVCELRTRAEDRIEHARRASAGSR